MRLHAHRDRVIRYVRGRRTKATISTIATAAAIAQTPSALMLAPQRLTRSLSDMAQLSIKTVRTVLRGDDLFAY